MKLLGFKVVGVRGFLTKEISFRDSVTFLIGINGSGKTTILDLMYGLLNPCLKKLLTIDYKEITLVCQADDKFTGTQKIVHLISKKQDDDFIVAFHDEQNSVYEIFTLPNVIDEEQYFNEWEESFSELENSFAKSEVYKKIKGLSTPVILNLNRSIANFIDIYSPFRNRHISNIERKTGHVDDITRALYDVQELVYLNIRQNARQQSRLAENFKNKVFEEMFKTPQNKDFNLPGSNNTADYTRISDLRKALFDAESLDDETTKLTQKVNSYLAGYESTLQEYVDFFKKNKKLSHSDVSEELFKKMVVYEMQYNKIMNLAEYAKVNMQEVRKLHEPIERFVNSVNLFFKEGKKEVRITGSGDILVLNYNKGAKIQESIFNLSSGEKQLIILIACLSLLEEAKRSHVYIVDEPEVSLHITWQEKFIDALLAASPNTQFILATHSPSIIARNERRSWCEDLTMNYDGARI